MTFATLTAALRGQRLDWPDLTRSERDRVASISAAMVVDGEERQRAARMAIDEVLEG